MSSSSTELQVPGFLDQQMEEGLSCSLHPFAAMILSQISYLDCVAFLVFLTPQLLVQIGLFPVLKWLIPALPFIGEFAYRISFRY